MKQKLLISQPAFVTGSSDCRCRSDNQAEIKDSGYNHLRFGWRLLVVIILVSVVIQSCIFCGCFVWYLNRLRKECDVFGRQEVEGILREQLQLMRMPALSFTSEHNQSSNKVKYNVALSRMRRQSNVQDFGSRVTTPKTARNVKRSQRQKRTRTQVNDFSATGIHLELSVPNLEQRVYERLANDNTSSESVEYGRIFSGKRFKPHADRLNNETVRYSFRNWVPAKWFNSSSSTVFRYESNRGIIHILQPGLYFVYSQIRLYHRSPCSYGVMINDDRVLFKCLDGTDGPSPPWQYSNCHMGGVVALNPRDRLWLRDMYGEFAQFYEHYVHLDPALGASSYWGAIRLGHPDTWN